MRKIVLTLADGVTCAECRFYDFGECVAFGVEIEIDPDGDSYYDRLRAPECLAAEAAASRLVEIAPEDADTLATIVDDWNRRCLPEADLPESIARIRDVLRDHAGPDR